MNCNMAIELTVELRTHRKKVDLIFNLGAVLHSLDVTLLDQKAAITSGPSDILCTKPVPTPKNRAAVARNTSLWLLFLCYDSQDNKCLT